MRETGQEGRLIDLWNEYHGLFLVQHFCRKKCQLRKKWNSRLPCSAFTFEALRTLS